VTSLPHGAAVSHVFTDPSNGLLSVPASSSSRKFFLETSTIEVRISNEVLKEVEKSGLGDFIDCPVSGGIPSAHQGNLTFMVGGSEALFQKAKPVLVSMGKEKNLLFCGRPGAGLATKQINNYCANVAFIALCEGLWSASGCDSDLDTDESQTGMNTGIKYGLDPKVLAGESQSTDKKREPY
jgi:3-hydroxyisobutyrate dehydrogenase-like beta-hydroxyacid dehydrogenase